MRRRAVSGRTFALNGAVLVWLGGGAVWAASFGWRGDGTGRFPDAKPPLRWSAESNVVWKTKLPGWSNASPCVLPDRLFVCSEPASLICVSMADGAILWSRPNTYADILPASEQDAFRREQAREQELRARRDGVEKQVQEAAAQLKEKPDDADAQGRHEQLKAQSQALANEIAALPYALPPSHDVNGYATPTPATDGRRVYALFNTGVVACYDPDGNRLWARVVEKPDVACGNSSSPVLSGGLLVVHLRQLTALDPATGETRWQAPSPQRYGSPVAARLAGVDAVVTANGDVFRAADGSALAAGLHVLEWPSPVVEGDTVCLIENNGKAVRLAPGGEAGAVAETLWTTEPKKERYYASPVCHDGLIYAVTQQADLSVIDAATGAVVYERRIDFGGTSYPSPTLAGNAVFISSDNGTTVVLAPGREYREVARNSLEPFRSNPVFVGNRMYVRGLNHLYCIAAETPGTTAGAAPKP